MVGGVRGSESNPRANGLSSAIRLAVRTTPLDTRLSLLHHHRMNSTCGLQEQPAYLFSSARYDPALLDVSKNSATDPPSAPTPYSLLPYHQQRLVVAAEAFGWTKAVDSIGEEGGAAMMRKELDRAVKKWEGEGKGEKGRPLKVSLRF